MKLYRIELRDTGAWIVCNNSPVAVFFYVNPAALADANRCRLALELAENERLTHAAIQTEQVN